MQIPVSAEIISRNVVLDLACNDTRNPVVSASNACLGSSNGDFKEHV